MHYLPIALLLLLLIAIFLGIPVAFALPGTALLIGLIAAYLDILTLSDLGFIPARVFGIMNNFTLTAVPLFIFMGIILERTGVAANLLLNLAAFMKRAKPSLAIAVVLVGALLAASTGIVGATVVTLGILAIPSMLESGYKKSFACGTIAASGTLGQIIPPSVILVLLGDMMNLDVGDLFLGAIVPGILLVLFYLLYVLIAGPKNMTPASSKPSTQQVLSVYELLKALLPPLIMMIIVLGSIMAGMASPTEAAACGAIGAMIIAASRKQLNIKNLVDTSISTAKISAMVFFILIGAQFFGVIFRGIEGEAFVIDAFSIFGGNQQLVVFAVLLLLFLLGFFLDFLEICFIIIPIMMPILKAMQIDPLWMGIMIAINLQTSFLTPPFGFALFYLKGITPPDVKTRDIYWGILPFVCMQLIVLALIWLFPVLATWLPRVIF